MKTISKLKIAAVALIAFTFFSACREDSEDKFNPNDMNYITFEQQFDIVYNGTLYSYAAWDIDTANIIGRHDYWRAQAVELDKKDSVSNESLEKIYKNMYGTLLDHHMLIMVMNLKPGPSDLEYPKVYVRPGDIEVKSREDYERPMISRSVITSIIDNLDKSGRISRMETYKGVDIHLISCLIDNNILYLRLSDFSLFTPDGIGAEEKRAEVKRVMDNYCDIISTKADLKGVIIDLRNNGGGYIHDLFTVLGTLTDSERLLCSSRTKNGTGMYDYNPFVRTYMVPAEKHILNKDAKIVGLCNMGSVSCAEVSTSFIKELPNGHIIGTRTYGGTCALDGIYDSDYAGTFGSYENGTHFVYLPNLVNLFGEDMKLYEGIGVPPDEVVRFDYDTYKNSKEDNQLNAAIEYIRK